MKATAKKKRCNPGVLLSILLPLLLPSCGLESPRLDRRQGTQGGTADDGNPSAGGSPEADRPSPDPPGVLDDDVSPGGPGDLDDKDCRDDWKEFPWARKGEDECTKCWTCPGVGFLPGAAFVACKIDGKCYRFATTDNCNYEHYPPGSPVMPVLPPRDPNLYCRKDGVNYTYFVCRINGEKHYFQTVDGTHYYDKAAQQNNMIGNVADNLPILGGCPDKEAK